MANNNNRISFTFVAKSSILFLGLLFLFIQVGSVHHRATQSDIEHDLLAEVQALRATVTPLRETQRKVNKRMDQGFADESGPNKWPRISHQVSLAERRLRKEDLLQEDMNSDRDRKLLQQTATTVGNQRHARQTNAPAEIGGSSRQSPRNPSVRIEATAQPTADRKYLAFIHIAKSGGK